MAVLTPVLTGGNGIPTYNLGIAETYSWIPIQNDQSRPMYARAGYITNLKDLQISLSASNLNIGTVHLQDGQDGSLASVVQAGTKYALLVQNQDLVSTIDSITIGDNKGNLATVTASSLNVNVTNVNALTANLATSINQVITNTFLNSITANQSTQITLEKTLSANSVYGTGSNQPLYTSITNPISGNVGVATALNWGITIVAVTSSAYVQFPSNVAHVASLMNTTGGILYVGKWNNNSTVGLPLLNNSSIEINLTGNTNEIGVKSTLAGTVSAYAMYTDWNS